MNRRSMVASSACWLSVGCLTRYNEPKTISLGESYSTDKWKITLNNYEVHPEALYDENGDMLVLKLKAENLWKYENYYIYNGWELFRGGGEIGERTLGDVEYPNRYHWSDSPQAEPGETLLIYGGFKVPDGIDVTRLKAGVDLKGKPPVDVKWRLDSN